MKKLLYNILSVLLVVYILPAQMIRPIQSDAMYHQLRSMETGPWSFEPKGYYYSWYMKTIVKKKELFGVTIIPEIKTKVPGMGVHDKGMLSSGITVIPPFKADGYVNKYSPNAQIRAQMFALSEITKKQYAAIAEKHQEIGEREAIDATDRQVNLAIQIYDDKLRKASQRIQHLCQEYDQVSGFGASQLYRSELERIKENLKFIGQSYSRNAERSKVYLSELQRLEKLKRGLIRRIRVAIASQKLQQIQL